MPRPPRLHVPGAFYHVTLRGNHRQPIFACETDRQILEHIVRESIEVEGARVHAYCWMTNHIHLLIQISNIPLGRVMLRIASRYARTVQARVPTTGHLFERRYHAVLIDVDAYLLTVVRYIHNNPLQAGIVKTLRDYRWSSHGVYAGLRCEEWVTTDFVFSILAQDSARAVQAYRQFMHNPVDDDLPSPHPDDTRVLGDSRFVAKVRPVTAAECSSLTIDELIADASEHFGVSPHDVTSPNRGRQLAVARAWIAHRATREGVASICEVARRLQRHEASVRGLMRRHPLKLAE